MLTAALDNCAGFDVIRVQMAEDKVRDARNDLQAERLEPRDQLLSQHDRLGVASFVITWILQRMNGGHLGGKAYHPRRCDRAQSFELVRTCAQVSRPRPT